MKKLLSCATCGHTIASGGSEGLSSEGTDNIASLEGPWLLLCGLRPHEKLTFYIDLSGRQRTVVMDLSIIVSINMWPSPHSTVDN